MISSEPLLHLDIVVAKSILPRDLITLREVIDPLVWLHSIELINLDCAIGPEQVPLVIRILVVCHVWRAAQAHFESVPGNIADDTILGH